MTQRRWNGKVGSIFTAAAALRLAAFAMSACGSRNDTIPIGGARSAVEDPIALSACTEITSPGSYLVTADLTGGAAGCFAIHDTSQVTLDCAGHTVTTDWQAIVVERSSGVTIQNCHVQPPPGWSGLNFIVQFDSSPGGTFTGNTVGNAALTRDVQLMMQVSASNGLLVQSNSFYGAYQQDYSSSTIVDGNSLTCTSALCAAVVSMTYGGSNRVSNNQIDGTVPAHGSQFSFGADDGIVISEEHDDVITGNNIHNTWDCGIETGGTISNSKISWNTISNTTFCGIGGWYWMSLSNSNILRNTISGTSNAFTFFRIYGLRPANWNGQGIAGDTGVFFTGNTFDGNTFSNGFPNSTSSYVPFQFGAGTYLLGYNGATGSPSEVVPSASQFSLLNNRFSNNDFGASAPPAFFGDPAYAGGVIDGGNNVCNRAGTAADYPLACVPGPACTSSSDCASSFCLNGICQAPACTDGHQNGAESDVDCGGADRVCPRCAAGQACRANVDCAGRFCLNGTCVTPTCTDGFRNGTESDVDCGGTDATCPRCADHVHCIHATDCTSGVCGVDLSLPNPHIACLAPTCSDATKNGAESDVDCGGANGVCPRCAVGRACTGAVDCASGFCLNGACVTPTCTDGYRNGSESDVDCGDADGVCPRCADHLQCVRQSDCTSGVCGIDASLPTPATACLPPTCSDATKNGLESDVDCGGVDRVCPRCAAGQACRANVDCAGRFCLNGTCVTPTCTDGFRNGLESDVDCGGTDGTCPRCADHLHCIHQTDCASGICGVDLSLPNPAIACLPST
jgi:parallel beta-helix repeat protein